jgi:DNA-directed RNA polymerase specialized sigma24 family protein
VEEEETYTVQEAARILRISEWTVSRRLQRDEAAG